MSADIISDISDLAMDMAMERHGAFNAVCRADEYTDLAWVVYRNHIGPQAAIKRALIEAAERAVDFIIMEYDEDAQSLVAQLEAAIAMAGGAA